MVRVIVKPQSRQGRVTARQHESAYLEPHISIFKRLAKNQPLAAAVWRWQGRGGCCGGVRAACQGGGAGRKRPGARVYFSFGMKSRFTFW